MRIWLIVFLINQVIANQFILMVPLYREKDEVRRKEYITCLEKNLDHPRIKHIHVLYDCSQDPKQEGSLLDYLKSKSVSISYIKRRQTFGDFFRLANAKYSGEKIILANADIYFNQTLLLLDEYDLTNKFVALTRWEDFNGRLEMHRIYDQQQLLSHAQDVWIFLAPIVIKKDHIPIGTIGCDPYIARQAEINGYEVINPCLSIQCCHLHASGIRHYDQNKPYDVKRGKELVATYL